jgi:AAA15 family ATPase/GTPase
MTKSLESLTIHQFRGLRDLEFKDLGQINLLVGVNNSGKTSVLEALNIYCHPFDVRTWLNTALQRDQENVAARNYLHSIDALQWFFPNILTSNHSNPFKWLCHWCQEMNVQLFATTHSLEAVDALLEATESSPDLVLYRLEPKEGKTRVVRHDRDRLQRLRENLGQEVR